MQLWFYQPRAFFVSYYAYQLLLDMGIYDYQAVWVLRGATEYCSVP